MADKQTRATAGDDKRLTHLLDLTAQIISSHASSTSVESEQLPGLIDRVFGSLKALNLDAALPSSAVAAELPAAHVNSDAKALAAPKTSRPRKTSSMPRQKNMAAKAAAATEAPRRARGKTVAAAPRPMLRAPGKREGVAAVSADVATKIPRRRKNAATAVPAAVSVKRSSRAAKAESAPATNLDKPRRKARSGAKTAAPKPARARKAKTDAGAAKSVSAPTDQPAAKRRRLSKSSGEADPSARKVRRGVVALAVARPAAVMTPSDEAAPALARQPRRKLGIVTKG
jgi:hypothetical protein